MSGSREILTVYKKLLQASLTFKDYNFRNYFYRKTQHEFRNVNSKLTLTDAYAQLSVISKQAQINAMYCAEKTVVEEPWVDRADF